MFALGVCVHCLQVPEPYMYVTNKQPGGLEAGKVYQFQVFAVPIDAETPEEKSRWSSTISFDYISPEPPLFRVAQRLVSVWQLVRLGADREVPNIYSIQCQVLYLSVPISSH